MNPTRRQSTVLVLTGGLVASACASSSDADTATDVGAPATTAAAVTSTVAEQPVTLSSDDGRLTVTFPAGSLDPGVSTSVDVVAVDGGVPTYRLLPDGADLQAPATLELRLALDSLPAAPPSADGQILPLALASDDGALAATEIALTDTEAIMQAEIIRLSTVSAAIGEGGPSFRFEQSSPGPTTPVGAEFDAVVEFTGSDGTSVPVLSSRWFLDGELTAENPTGVCPPEPGPFFGLGVFVVDADAPVLVEVPIETECVEPVVETELGLADPPFETARFEGDVIVRWGPEGFEGIGFDTADIPDGGSIGINVVAEDMSAFVECLIDRRPGIEGARCVARDGASNLLERVEIDTVDDDGVTFMPVALLDPVVRSVVLGSFVLTFGEATVNRFEADGTASAALIDEETLFAGQPGNG